MQRGMLGHLCSLVSALNTRGVFLHGLACWKLISGEKGGAWIKVREERGRTKSWLPHGEGSKGPPLPCDLFVVIWSVSWFCLSVSLSLCLPVPLFLSQETGMHVHKASTTALPFAFPLWANKMLFFSSQTSCILDTQCTEPQIVLLS